MTRTPLRKTALAAAVLVAVGTLGACQTTGGVPGADLEFRQDRYDEVMRIDTFDSCRREALDLDAQARMRESAGAYLTSAKVMDRCEQDLAGQTRGVDEDARMRLQALAVVNYLKGGDAQQARANLDAFKAAFSGRDLYFQDGASFIETAELLLGRYDSVAYGAFSMMNVNAGVKDELRRVHHWTGK
jgi:hypothetical protein